MDHRDKLFDIVKQKGPLLPAQINKEMHTNVLFASAMLAEMVDNKKLKLTSMKIGGSPLYYSEGQEHLLENFAHKLAQGEFRAYELLKKQKVLRDRDQETDIRVALREIKDFSVALEVTLDGTADLYWKYYLVSDDDARNLIWQILSARIQPAEELQPAEEVQSTIVETVKKEPKKHEELHRKSSVSVSAAPESAISDLSYSPSVSFSTSIDMNEKVKIEKRKPEAQESLALPMVFPEEDDFFSRVKAFFDSAGINILEFTSIKKGSEFDFVISLPTNIGSLNYYCKAKSKAKVSDIDLSAAFVRGQMKKLPIIFLTPGDLTKGAREMLVKELKGIYVKKIE
jgi:hypothetical protein